MRAIILAAFVCAYAPNAHSQGAAAVPVGVVQAELRPIAKTLDFVGRVDAINRVGVRARVKGYLEAVLFKEGDLVNEGQPLYRIEKGLFQAAVEQAQGRLQTGKAQHELAVKNRQRQEELFAKNVSAGKQLDEAVASEGEAKGAIMTNEADLQTAQINLGYTDIVAPHRRQDRANGLDQGQRRQSGQRRPHDDRQLGSHVCDVPGEPARIPARNSDRPCDRCQKHQGTNPILRRIAVRPAG
jgi:RND family efflux transporter, MFP subunit